MVIIKQLENITGNIFPRWWWYMNEHWTFLPTLHKGSTPQALAAAPLSHLWKKKILSPLGMELRFKKKEIDKWIVT